MDPESPNVLHAPGRRAHWSRANEKGVFPGVATPLNWSIWGEIGERGVRRAGFELGLLDEHELAVPAAVDDRMWSIFYGRPASNVDAWRMLYERGAAQPGGGGAAQRQVFGAAPGARPAATACPAERRATIEARRPATVRDTPARLRAEREACEAWWRDVTIGSAALERRGGERIFADAIERFERADPHHIVVSLLATEAVTEIATAAESIGRPELANALMVGYPGMEEFLTTVALWDLSRDRIRLEAFLAGHGFHGPREGEIASRSWREDAGPVVALAERFRALPEHEDPRRREASSVAKRERLESELRAAVAAELRAGVDEACARAAIFLPLRETGRATLTIALDAMRAGARAIARDLVRRGELAAEQDVFLLTREELLDPPPRLRALVEGRRALHEAYAAFELPEIWTGTPEKIGARADDVRDRAPEALSVGERLEGLGASAGVHEGEARVVLDPAALAEAFEPGDVLVAAATDPSWAPFFLVAGAVVIDTGSNISHAAVVAREMGIPAVVGAGDASRRLVTGQRVRVDGGSGTVEVIA